MKLIKLAIYVVFALFAGLGMGAGISIYSYYSSQLPELEAAINYRPAIIAHVYDQNGLFLADFAEEQRIPVSLSEIAPVITQAVIATEDQTFYSHKGLDLIGIIRAAWVNFRAGEVVQGGSTLTQQLAKSLFLSDERKLERKIKEAILAFRLEEELTKDRILELYLNQVYFGSGAYGIEAAARRYFSKSAGEINLQEAAVLASLPKAPSRLSPLVNPQLVLERRNIVLQRMAEKGMISEKEAAATSQMGLGLNPSQGPPSKAYYFVEILRRSLEKEYGYRALYRSGWDIHTTLNLEYQSIAEDAVRANLFDIEKRRRNWKGPIDLQPATVPPDPGKSAVSVITRVGDKDLTLKCGGLECTLEFRDIWVKNKDLLLLKPGDKVHFVVNSYTDSGRTAIESGWIVQEPEADAALLSMSVQSGEVLAWVGGYDFWRSQFDRVSQSYRQPGSAFKPFIYAQAIEAGFTAADVVYDTPIVVEKTWKTRAEINQEIAAKAAIAKGLGDPGPQDTLSEIEFWKPQNYSQEFFGATTLREGLAKSRNIISIHLLRELTPSKVIQMARKMGIVSPLSPTLSLALGSSEVSLMEITQAYGTFANAGIRNEALMIRKIIDRDRKVIREYYPAMRPAIHQDTAYLVTNLLQAVITEGTGFSASELGYPLAGKTGTTNDYYDAWFIGFSPYVVTGVWVGVDLQEPIFQQATGASAALPIWKQFMQIILKDYDSDPFPIPKNIVFANVCRLSGKLASGACLKTVNEAFRTGTSPLEYCNECETDKKTGLKTSVTDHDWDSMDSIQE